MSRIKLTLILSFTMLVLVVLGFTGTLNMLSFKKQFTDSLVNSYVVVARESVQKIEYAVKYGKPIDNFYGIENLLNETKRFSEEITNIEIVSPDGSIIYNLQGKVDGQSITGEQKEATQFEARSKTNQLAHVIEGDTHLVNLPIFDGQGAWIATYRISFADAIIQSEFNYYANQILIVLGICGAAALVFLIIYNLSVKLIAANGDVRKTHLLVLILSILFIAQSAFGLYNFQLFKEAYYSISKKTVELASSTIKYNIESLIQKGVAYDQMHGIDDYFANTTKSIPLIARIQLTDMNVAADATNALAANNGSTISYELPKDRKAASYRLDVLISDDVIAKQLRNTIFDGGTVLVISFLFLVEITIFLILILRRVARVNREQMKTRAEKNTIFDGEMIRPLTFLFAFAIFMPLSFIPVAMKGKVDEFLGLAPEVLFALPITVEILFAFIATMIAGAQIDKYGWRKGFLFGALAFGLGSFLSGIANEYEMYLIGRMIVGLGYGFGLLALRAYVQFAFSADRQSGGFSSLFSGLYAGVNGGVIVGALLADRLSYSFVFILASALILISVCISLYYMNAPKRIDKLQKEQEQRNVSVWKSFLLQPSVLGFFVLLIVPIAISGMFLDYYFPVFAESQGVSSADVGRVFLLHGLIIVYLGPLLLKWTEKWWGVNVSVIISGLVVVAGLMLFAGLNTVSAAVIAVVLLGLSDSFGLVAQNNYLLRLPQTKQIGSSRALSYFDNFRKFGQMVSPMIFSALAFMGSYAVGLLGVVFIVLILGFAFIALRKNQAVTKENA